MAQVALVKDCAFVLFSCEEEGSRVQDAPVYTGRVANDLLQQIHRVVAKLRAKDIRILETVWQFLLRRRAGSK